MDTYTASNGVTVSCDGETVTLENPADPFGPAEGVVTALREFFQHERDEELGRWRWPENPDYVVYLDAAGKYIDQPAVIVVNEQNGATAYCGKDGVYSASGIGVSDEWCEPAARAYFAAHPEPKPWHDAKHNEIWVLFVAICDEAYRVDGDAFVPVNSPGRVRIPLTDDRIQSARRIFPEVSDE